MNFFVEISGAGIIFLRHINIVRENQDKSVTKRGTTFVFVYKIDKNVLF